MSLIGKASFNGYLGDRSPAFELRPAIFEAAVNQVRVRRHAVTFLERTNQIGGREIRRSANLIQAQRLNAILPDVLGRARELEVSGAGRHRRRGQRAIQIRKEIDGNALLLQSV